MVCPVYTYSQQELHKSFLITRKELIYKVFYVQDMALLLTDTLISDETI